MQHKIKPEYEQRFHVRSYEVDLLHSIMPSSLLNYMQEVAATHAEKLGHGYESMMKEKRAWVLSRIYTELSGSAKIGEEILVETRISAMDRISGIRDFLITATDGNELARARTTWILVDIEKRKPVRLDSPEFPVSQKEPLFSDNPKKIENPSETRIAYERKIGYSCIDINQHVNNVKYVEFAMDAFPEDFLTTHRLSSFQVNFLSETKYGDLLSVSASPLRGGNIYVEGVISGKPTFQSLLSFTQV